MEARKTRSIETIYYDITNKQLNTTDDNLINGLPKKVREVFKGIDRNKTKTEYINDKVQEDKEVVAKVEEGSRNQIW